MAPGPEHATASPGAASTAVAVSREYDRRKLRGGIRPRVHRSPPPNEGPASCSVGGRARSRSRCSRAAHPRADPPPRASARSTCAVKATVLPWATAAGLFGQVSAPWSSPRKSGSPAGAGAFETRGTPSGAPRRVAQAMPTVGPALTLLFTFMTSFLSRVPNGSGCRWLVQASPIMSVVAVQVHRPDERDLDRQRRSNCELLALRHPPGRLSW